MSLDDPNAWRSTLDKNTGHTYYYHKKTRVSQWVKPDCLIVEEGQKRLAEETEFSQHQSLDSPGRHSSASSSPSRAHIIDTGRECFNADSDYEQGAALGLAAAAGYDDGEGEGGELDIEAVYQDYENDDYAEYDDYEAAAASAEAAMAAATAATGEARGGGYSSSSASSHPTAAAAAGVNSSIKQARGAAAQVQAQSLSSASADSTSDNDALDPAAVSMISQLVEQVALGSPAQVDEALELLLACCIPRTVDAIADEPGVLSTLAGAVLRSRTVRERRLALKCMWCLSTGTYAAGVYFVKDQSWAGLGEQVANWGDDIESLLIYSSMLGLLLGNKDARQIIDVERASHLADLIQQVAQEESVELDLEVLGTHPSDEGMSLLDSRVLQAQSAGTAGHPLSCAIVCALAVQCIRQSSRGHAVTFLKAGGIAQLQRVHAAPWAGFELRMLAHEQLLVLLEGSLFARESVLDALLATGSATARIPEPQGQDPLHRCSGFGKSDEDNETTTALANEEEEEEEDDSYLLSTQEKLETGLISETEFFEIDEASTLPRDVLWKPRSGCAWRVSSTLLWTRCPALRSTLEDLWRSEDGGELELGTNTSSNALACVVRYLHDGIFIPLSGFFSSLELVKLAQELGCQALVTAASNAVKFALDNSTAETVLTFASNMGLRALEDAAAKFMDGFSSAQGLVTFTPPGMQANAAAAENSDAALLRSMGMNSSRGNKAQGGSPKLNQKGHPQSGGIYGLLLQEQDQEEPEAGEMMGTYANNRSGSSSASATATAQKRMPSGGTSGRVPGRAPTQAKSSQGSAKAAFGRGSSAAAAGPGGKQKPGAGQNIKSAADVLGAGAEYSQDMSLAPAPKAAASKEARPMTDREKRLVDMSKPKEMSVKEKLAERKEAREKLLQRQKQHQEQARAQKDAEENRSDIADSPDSKAGFGGGGGGGGSMPKLNRPTRADSPEPEEPKDTDTDAPTEVIIDSSVRRSLASLKIKARQRRTGGDSTDKVDLSLMEPRSQEGILPVAAPPASSFSSSGSQSPTAPAPPMAPSNGSGGGRSACTRQQGCMCSDCREFGSSPLGSGKQIPLDSPVPSPASGASPERGEEQMPYEPAEYHHLDSPLQAFDGPDAGEYGATHEDDALENSADSGLEASWEEADAYPQGPPEQLHECGKCGRRFRAAALERHQKICGKQRVAKPLDMTKQRLNPEEQDLVRSLARQAKKAAPKKVGGGPGRAGAGAGEKWKQESEAFREAMRAGKETTEAINSGAPLPAHRPSGSDPSLVPCPHCGRSFNDSAAERHIPKCKNIKAKPSVLRAGSGRGIGTPSNKSLGAGGSSFNF